MRALLYVLILFPSLLRANGLELDALSLNGDNGVQFRITWENSWNYPDSVAPGNHDAVWVFVKGRSAATGLWEPILIHSIDVGLSPLLMANNTVTGTGAMLRRSEYGEGPVEEQPVSLFWEEGTDASRFSAINVYGIEMVYVHPGAYYLGDSVSTNTLIDAVDRNSYLVDNEGLISVGVEEGMLSANGDFLPAANIPAAFPKGYEGFYGMKYEISQHQYAAFLNTLSANQLAANRLSTAAEAPCFAGDHIEGERNYIREVNGRFGCDANGNSILDESDDGKEVACNFLTWSQLTAYLDWSGLRPMTELEYEKACRGPLAAVPLEYAWGTAEVVNTLQPTDLASGSEHCQDSIPEGHGIANYGYCAPSGPLRCGFAAHSADSRVTAAAGYYGMMEMSGNLWELCVVLTAGGLSFTGGHGDGILKESGMENAWNWSEGAGGFRGGGWNSGILAEFRDLAVSDRFFVYLDGNGFARGTTGGRGVISINQFE